VSLGGGFSARGRTGSSKQKNHTTVGRIPQGAIVEREVSSRFVNQSNMTVTLRHPDFTTAQRLALAINQELGAARAKASDPATITVKVPAAYRGNEVALLARMERVQVLPDAPASVIINERTGTVIVGQTVTLSPVAISHGSLTLEIQERFNVSQPEGAFTRGQTAVVPESEVTAVEQQSGIKLVKGGANIADVVKALNALGASPRDLVAIFQAIEQAGALPANLVIQ